MKIYLVRRGYSDILAVFDSRNRAEKYMAKFIIKFPDSFKGSIEVEEFELNKEKYID